MKKLTIKSIESGLFLTDTTFGFEENGDKFVIVPKIDSYDGNSIFEYPINLEIVPLMNATKINDGYYEIEVEYYLADKKTLF